MTPLAAALSSLLCSLFGPDTLAPPPPAAAACPAAAARPPAPGPRQPLSAGALLALAALSALLFLLRLGAPFLYDDSEARYAVVVREMAQTEDWLAPQFQGRPVHKPPLVFWMMEAARAVLGDGEAAARLPSAMAGVVAVLATAAFGARLFGAPAGFLAGVLLATMFQFIWLARKGQLDMPLTAFVVGAQLLLYRALHEGRAFLWAGGSACVALGAMAKGMSGVALPLGTLGLSAVLTGRLGALGRRPAWLAAAGGAAAVAVYYAALGPHFVRDFLYEDHLRRVVVGVDVVEPFWWYVPILALALLPYTGWLPFAWAALGPGRGGDREEATRRPAEPWWCGPAAFPLCWFALWFALISFSKGKQEQYVLPLMPPLAILLAAGLLCRETRGVPERWARAALATVPASIAVGSGIFLAYLARRSLLAAWPVVAFGVLGLVGIVGVWGAFRWPSRRALRAVVGAGVLTSLAVITAALPPLERERTAAHIAAARALRAAVGDAPLVSFGGPYTPPPRVTFYLNLPRPLRRLETPAELESFLRVDHESYLLLPRTEWEPLERARPLGRRVALHVSTGRADYVLLAPPR